MKKLVTTICLIGAFSLGMAQNVNDEIEILRDMAAAERKALVADNMQLTEEESDIFWPLYDEYRAEAKKLGTRDIKIIEEFANNYENMTDEAASKIMDDYYKNLLDEVKLKNTTKDKMSKVLSPKLVMRYMQIENKIDAIIYYAMSLEVPLSLKE